MSKKLSRNVFTASLQLMVLYGFYGGIAVAGFLFATMLLG